MVSSESPSAPELRRELLELAMDWLVQGLTESGSQVDITSVIIKTFNYQEGNVCDQCNV